MISVERTPVLSLTPDSISQLGNLDSSSLSELWGVFTKCKDSLKDGRRLENLSWRLWFDSGRRESGLCGEINKEAEKESNSIEPSQSNSEVDWSDPEWSEASDSDIEGESIHAVPRSARLEKGPTSSSATTSPDRSNNNNNGESTLATIARPTAGRVNSGGLRTACPLTGGSLQRMIIGLTTLPAITSYAHNSITTLPPTPPVTSIQPLTRLYTSPEFTSNNLPPPLIAVPETTKVDAPTQTTPSTSHRPSPAMKSPIALRRLSNQLASPNASLSTSSGIAKPSSSRRSPSSILTVAAQQEHARSLARGNSEMSLRRNDSFEPRSYVKGFDTTVFDSRPAQGSIAPPPTPAARNDLPLNPAPSIHRNSSATPPPSAMKSLTGSKKLPITSTKKIFFISSHSDSEEDGSSSISVGSTGLEGRKKSNSSSYRSSSIPYEKVPPPPPNSVNNNAIASTSRLPPLTSASPSSAQTSTRTSAPVTAPNAASADEWDDEDSSDTEDDESSGWGSEYSTESEANPRAAAADAPDTVERKPKALFAKRPSLPISSGVNPVSELKPRPPGLLSQLFHPDLTAGLGMNDRSRSEFDMRNGKREGLQVSKSTGVLTEKLRSKSFLRGAPEGTEMDSSSDEEEAGENTGGGGSDGFEDEDSGHSSNHGANHQTQAVSNALYRQQQQSQRQLELMTTATVPIAPPQTPRTTRRAMLATELSESLRRNLLWERQSRNRIMGGPVNARFLPVTTEEVVVPAPPPQVQPQPQSKTSKSKSTTLVPPILRRRNTTGTGLYLEGQMKKLAQGHRGPKKSTDEEDLSEESETELEESHKSRLAELTGTTSSFTGGVHSHGW